MYTDGQDPKSNVNKMSYVKVCDLMNTKYKLNDEKKKLTKSSVQRYINEYKIVGGSPLKSGPKSKVPPSFWELLNCHVTMAQLEGKAELRPRMMKALIGVCIKNTPWEGMSINVLYREFRHKHPDTVTPTGGMDVEMRRGIWTTYQTLTDGLMVQNSA